MTSYGAARGHRSDSCRLFLAARKIVLKTSTRSYCRIHDKRDPTGSFAQSPCPFLIAPPAIDRKKDRVRRQNVRTALKQLKPARAGGPLGTVTRRDLSTSATTTKRKSHSPSLAFADCVTASDTSSSIPCLSDQATAAPCANQPRPRDIVWQASPGTCEAGSCCRRGSPARPRPSGS